LVEHCVAPKNTKLARGGLKNLGHILLPCERIAGLLRGEIFSGAKQDMERIKTIWCAA
jgi:hypothetical protein